VAVSCNNTRVRDPEAFKGRGIIRTSVIGSWPKPDWLFRGLPSHSGDGEGLKSGFVESADEATRDRATQQAIDDQVAASLDVITDGEQRRENYIYYHVQKGFTNVDFDNRTEHIQRGGLEKAMAPTIRGKIEEKEGGFLVNDYLLAKAAAPPGTVIAVTIPGPMTLIDTLHDSFYNDEEKLCDDLVKVLRAEALRLIEAGVTYISVDEPVFVRYPDKVLKWGIKALDKLVEGLNAFRAVHICCSYPTCPHKADSSLYTKIAPLLAASSIDGISVEHANKAIDLEAVLRPLNDAGKSIILGCVRVHEDVETVEDIKERANEAMKYIAPEQLIIAPDCGLVCISREAAIAKMANLAQAAAELNEALAEGPSPSKKHKK